MRNSRPHFPSSVKNVAAFLLLCLWVLCAPGAQGQQSVTAIRGGTLIDGNGGAPVPNVLIVIAGNRIRSIAPGGAPPAGATVIEAQGKYIVPGLWDTHTHY